jgi:hypothetical protein
MEELFKKVYIKSEDDLPRDISNQYWVHFETNDMFYEMAYKIRHLWEQGVVDWYLQPIQPEPLSQRRTAERIMPNILTIFSKANKLHIYDFYEWFNPYMKELKKYTEK